MVVKMLNKAHRLVFGPPTYTAAQITSGDPLTYTVEDTWGVLLRVRPHTHSAGIQDAAGIYRSLHDVETSFWGSNQSDSYSFETWFTGEQLEFYVHAPTEAAADTLRRRLATNYPNTDIERVDTGHGLPQIKSGEYVAGARVSTTLGSYYPIRDHTNEGFDTDPYGELTREMLGGEETRVVTQVVFRPAKASWTSGSRLRSDSIDDIANGLRQGTSVGWLNPRTRPPSAADKRAAKILEHERDKPAYHTTIRVLAISPSKRDALARTRGVANIFETQYNGISNQSLEATPVWHRDDDGTVARLREFVEDVATRQYTPQQTVLTVDELAGVAHLPEGEVPTPNLDQKTTEDSDRVSASDNQYHFDEASQADGGLASPDRGHDHV